ncbi:MAG: MFS transporter [Actinomycetota bacterium]
MEAQQESSYLRRLIILLATATFFEGYDSAVNAIVLRDLARDFGIDVTETTRLTGPLIAIGLGSFGAIFITALGDRFGRKPLLIGTTLMYALFTGLTATAQNLTVFIVFQFFARAFLIAEYATAITMVTEEFPAQRRGRALGTLTAFGAFGLPVVAIVHLLVRNTALGWRAVYLVGLLPLVVTAFLRTKLRETKRYVAAKEAGVKLAHTPASKVLRGPHRRELFTVGAVFFLVHFALLGGATWWPLFAKEQRHFSESTITWLLATAYPLGVSGFFVAGRLQDRIGRRRTGTLFMSAGLVFGVATFHVPTPATMFPVMVLAVFFGFGIAPVLGAISSELFPTEIRATAVAFARSVLGTLGAIAGPVMVGLLADRRMTGRLPDLPLIGPVVGNLAGAVTLAALAYIPAIFVLRKLPETAGKELEVISQAP